MINTNVKVHGLTGIPRSEETKNKISATMRGNSNAKGHGKPFRYTEPIQRINVTFSKSLFSVLKRECKRENKYLSDYVREVMVQDMEKRGIILKSEDILSKNK